MPYRQIEPCLCGADDCRYCHPENRSEPEEIDLDEGDWGDDDHYYRR